MYWGEKPEGLILSQRIELEARIEDLDQPNKDFLTAFYYRRLRTLRDERESIGQSGYKLTDTQAAMLDQLTSGAQVQGLVNGVTGFINTRPDCTGTGLINAMPDCAGTGLINTMPDCAGNGLINTMPDCAGAVTLAELFVPYIKSIHLLVGQKYTDSFFAFLERMPYLAVIETMRSSNPRAYIGDAIYNLRLIHNFSLGNTDLMQFIRESNGGDTWPYENGTHILLATQLEHGNREIIDYISDIITAGENGENVSNTIIKAVLCARNTRLHEQLGKLLLAPKLQERLLVSILKAAAYYSREAFIVLLDVVNKNDLISLPQVKKAVSGWLNFGIERAKSENVYSKILQLISEYLLDPDARRRAIQNGNSPQLLAGLWSIAFHDIVAVSETVRGILKSGDRRRMKIVAYFLLNSKIKSLKVEATETVLTLYSDDIELCATFDYFFFKPVFGAKKQQNVLKTDFYNYGYSVENDQELTDFFVDKTEAIRFYHIYANLIGRMGVEFLTSEAGGVSWYGVTMQRQHLLCKMLGIIYLTQAIELIDDYLKYWNLMSPEMRANSVYYLLKAPTGDTQWNTIINALGDKSRLPREAAYECLSELSISPGYILRIEGYLKLKSGDLRQKSLDLLIRQPNEQILDTLRRLLTSSSHEMRQGGLSLAMEIEHNDSLQGIHEAIESLVSGLTNTTHTEIMLANQVRPENKAGTNAQIIKNAFGLADPTFRSALPAIGLDFELRDVFLLSWDRILEILDNLMELIQKHADYEYRNHLGQTTNVGNGVSWLWQSGFYGVSSLPLAGVWRKFYAEQIKDPQILFQLYLFRLMTFFESSRVEKFDKALERIYGQRLVEIKKAFPFDIASAVTPVLQALYQSFSGKWPDGFMKITKLCGYIWNNLLPDERWVEKKQYNGDGEQITIFNYNHLNFLYAGTINWKTDDEFKAAFAFRYAIHLERQDREHVRTYNRASLYKNDSVQKYGACPAVPSLIDASGYNCQTLDMLDFAKAVNLGLVPFCELILEMTCRTDAVSRLNNAFEGLLEKRDTRYTGIDRALLQSAVETVVSKYVDIELARGDIMTPATPFVPFIKKVAGISKFVALLRAVGDLPLASGRDSSNFRQNAKECIGRMDSLSNLLYCSCPADDETAVMLAEALSDIDIPWKRLVELAMFNPNWTKLIGEYLGWEGFEGACWFFRAHTSECFTKDAAVEIGKYTSIPVNDLKDGAFDAMWYEKVSAILGDQRYSTLYDAAKCTATDAKHKRAGKFADAVRGLTDARDTCKKVTEKRGKDLLLLYTLIPLKDKNDLLDRYLFLKNFLKESKQFGWQRQESEKDMVRLSMGNLARTAGYSNRLRLIWAMEVRMFAKIRPFFTPQKIQDIYVHIQTETDGLTRIVCSKAGSILNNVPIALRNDETIVEMQTICKTLSSQHRYARIMLEHAMIDEEPFEVAELCELFNNPVVFPLICNLVFREGNSLGYLHDGELVDITGSVKKLDDSDTLTIAHPIHLYESGNWRAWQTDLFKRHVRQPFKQIFRELYLKLPEELDRFDATRYEGRVIKQRQVYPLLTSYRWIEAGHNSMQKVFYKQDTYVLLSINTNWNVPVQADPAMMCSIEFHAYDNDTRKPISKISSLVFSETLRDVDLVLNEAPAGSVSTQCSHSTIVMRSAIARCTLDFHGINNVQLEGSHAIIEGKLAKYSIHLGNGVIHQSGGALISIQPIRSRKSARVFLPYVDDDIMTAEILTKILLFANDQNISDPSILLQIKQGKTEQKGW